MNFRPFAVEQFLSENEQGVEFNFSESGVHPLTLAELCDLADIDPDRLWATCLDYPQVNGTARLRGLIAAIYGVAADQVLVTVGATEANSLVANTLLSPGQNMVRFRPTYEQLPGNVSNRAIALRNVDLIEAEDWAVDRAALEQAVDANTRVIHVVNPNNPTGRVLSDPDRRAIIHCAEKVGAWIVADEVYAGTERDSDTPTRSFWGDYDRVVVINSMSKAYGLPGLRLGWVVADAALITGFWRRHEYAAISAATLSMVLAEHALMPDARSALMRRARGLIRRGFDQLQNAINSRPQILSVVPPQASAMSFLRAELPISDTTFAQYLRAHQNLLVIPGSAFGVPGHFRFSSALPDEVLQEGLRRLVAEIDAQTIA